jgi:hypothetical protein
LNFFSLGQGGYFSPKIYALGSVPVVLSGRYDRLEYSISGSGGVQDIVQDPSPFYPTSSASMTAALPAPSGVQTPTQSPTQGFYDGQTSAGPNYYALVRVGYRLASLWYLDAFATANNARDFTSRQVGIILKLLVQPLHDDLHLLSVPDWKGNQPFHLR